MLRVCIDTNIWLSGILFSGKPARVVSAAFSRKFQVICSHVILEELERNLLKKFKFGAKNTRKMINRIIQISEIYEPTGSVRLVPLLHTDNLVLEIAARGRAKYFVTGDKEHLLPIKVFRNVKILDAAAFLDQTGY